MTTLRLGHTDQNKLPDNPLEWLAPFHRAMAGELKQKRSFRDDPDGNWQSFQEVPGRSVMDLQEFLLQAGFFPKTEKSGIFGYGTRSALRLFQEYIRQVEGKSFVVPDGVCR